MITREQATMIADLVRTVRPAWDALAIINALGKVADRSLPDIASASIKAALDPTLQTPKAIAFNGDHWPRETRKTHTSYEALCRVCSRTRGECIRVRDREIRNGVPDPHEFEARK